MTLELDLPQVNSGRGQHHVSCVTMAQNTTNLLHAESSRLPVLQAPEVAAKLPEVHPKTSACVLRSTENNQHMKEKEKKKQR